MISLIICDTNWVHFVRFFLNSKWQCILCPEISCWAYLPFVEFQLLRDVHKYARVGEEWRTTKHCGPNYANRIQITWRSTTRWVPWLITSCWEYQSCHSWRTAMIELWVKEVWPCRFLKDLRRFQNWKVTSIHGDYYQTKDDEILWYHWDDESKAPLIKGATLERYIHLTLQFNSFDIILIWKSIFQQSWFSLTLQ